MVHEEIAWDLAREIAGSSFPRLISQIIPLNNAIGRVLAKDALSLVDLPTYETSAMDGWVVSGIPPWKIVGEIVAGTLPTHTLESGETLKISTGGVIPSGGEGVLRWERAIEESGFITGPISIGEDIRPAGVEAKKNEILISAGTTLTPAMVGLLAATGYDSVEVAIKPRTLLLILGDELLHDGLPRGGKVRDSLEFQIPAMLAQLGCDVIATTFVKDTLESTLAAFNEFLPSIDLLVTTGGTADGPRDHVHAAIEKLGGRYLIDSVKCRPGHPMLLAKIKRSGRHDLPVLGLPGNPQSAVVALLSLGIPVIESLLSKTKRDLEELPSRQELSTSPGFNRLVAGNIVAGTFESALQLGSAMLRGLAHSTGFAVLPTGVTKPGGFIRWLPLP